MDLLSLFWSRDLASAYRAKEKINSKDPAYTGVDLPMAHTCATQRISKDSVGKKVYLQARKQ
jgi:hypothetical protein